MGSSERAAFNASVCRPGMKQYDESCTSFIRCFQMNQRKEPRAHSLLRLDLPRARLRGGSFAGMLSRDLRESRGNQTGEGHSQG